MLNIYVTIIISLLNTILLAKLCATTWGTIRVFICFEISNVTISCASTVYLQEHIVSHRNNRRTCDVTGKSPYRFGNNENDRKLIQILNLNFQQIIQIDTTRMCADVRGRDAVCCGAIGGVQFAHRLHSRMDCHELVTWFVHTHVSVR